MKVLLTLVLCLLLGLPVFGGGIQPPKGFVGDVFNATFALYGTVGRDSNFLCTATAFETIPGGYRLLSAGHCVRLVDHATKFAVAEDIGGPLQPVTVVKSEYDDKYDFSIFELQTDHTYPVMPLGSVDKVSIGDPTVSVNFALGIGKQLSEGVVASEILGPSEECPTECTGGFMEQEFGGPGSSGSAIITKTDPAIIGIAVEGFGGTVGLEVEPIDKLAGFLKAPDQPWPEPKKVSLIPADEFKKNFGKKHPFHLTAQGPDPTFTQAGYTFKADASGFALSEPYYYKAKVYIDELDGVYRLVSTKKGNYSVNIDLVEPEE